ncbi:DUF3014 domain-containing protein [Glaciecola sp. 1036]|uniref:DUF3014 domain-containing protein n=1 Tax=Alteromonadaceae TaxID=72275 RepID=UPI003D049953
MSEQPTQLQQMKPYIIASVVLFIILVAVVFWPTSDEPEVLTAPQEIPVPTQETVEEAQLPEQEDDDSLFEALPDTQEVVIGAGETEDQVENLAPVIEDPEPEPLDVNDDAIKSALAKIITSEQFSRLIVDESLLQKFVINVNNLANNQASPKDSLVEPPKQSFRVYQQADRTWIEPSSYQRYTPYVDMLEAADVEDLVGLLDTYRSEIEARFAEISRPNENFNDTLIAAIDTLLDTPQVPVPIEVYSDSVMYKFKDERLEALSLPQKQMLRMGPDNMRRLKDILREIKSELE